MISQRSLFQCVGIAALMLFAIAETLFAADAPTQQHFNPNIELPEGEGKQLILRACTQCHELAGLAGYKGYWNRSKWKEMVVGMVKHGSALSPSEQDVVTDYLTQHFGPKTQQ